MTATLLIASCLLLAPDDFPFGFRDLEIFRTSPSCLGLLASDVNGDGMMDLVYADNQDATICILFQVAPGELRTKAPPVSSRSGASVNEIRSDERFQVKRFYTEKRVTSLGAADLDSDGKIDLVYYGNPRELEVVYQSGDWGSRREKIAIPDALETRDALVVADLDGDGRKDLILLGKGKTYLIRQRSEGTGLEKPQVIYNSSVGVSSVRVGDINRDGRPDLLFLQGRASHPFLIRFQGEGASGGFGGFGPEIPQKSLPVHWADMVNLEGSGRHDLLTIQGNTRRIRALRWGKPKQSPEPKLSEPRLYGFRPRGEPSQRRIHFGDVDGDGRVDLAVSSAETAELDLYLQSGRSDLSAPSPSPTLAEVKGIATGDLDGDGKPETIVVSAREKTIGVSRWVSTGRLSIPETHVVDGSPLLVAAGRLDGNAKKDGLVTVHKDPGGLFHVTGYSLGKKGLSTLGKLSFKAGAEPSQLSLFDANGDGLLDILVFVPYENPRLYLREAGPEKAAGKDFQFREVSREQDFGIGQLTNLTPQAFSLADFTDSSGRTQKTMMVAQKSFARALVVDPAGKLKVIEQFSGNGAAAKILGAAALNLDDDPESEVLLFDRTQYAIQILDRNSQGAYREARSISMPGFEFEGFRVLDLNGDGQDDAALLGKTAVGIVYQGGGDGQLQEFARYDLEDPILKDGKIRAFPSLLVVGDLNADGRRDVVFAAEPLNLLGFLDREPGDSEGTFRLKMAFPVFEEKSFQRDLTGRGPREMLARDVTGDGKTDLLLLIHDRILLYPQE